MPWSPAFYTQISFELNTQGRWWLDGSIGALIEEALRASDLWLDFTHYNRGFRRSVRNKYAKLPQPVDVGALSKSWKERTVLFAKSAIPNDDASSLQIYPMGGYFDITLIIAEPELAPRRVTLVPQFRSLVRHIFDRLSATVSIQQCSFCPRGLHHPRPSPPCDPMIPFDLGNLFDIYDLEYVRKHRSQREVDAIVSGSLPAGVVRDVGPRLVTIQWIQGLDDVDAMVAAASAQELWLTQNLELQRSSAFNDLGDEYLPFGLSGAVPRPPLTFWAEGRETGYKAIVPTPEGGVDEDEWQEIVGWVAAKKLPDGSPLPHLTLLTPNRQTALAIYDRARAEGIETVYYSDGKSWLDPRPPGLWLRRNT
jgi:hypothetical protein